MRVRTRGAIWSRSSASAVSMRILPTTSRTAVSAAWTTASKGSCFQQPSPGIIQTILNGKLDLDDVLVFGQHRGLSQPVLFDDRVTSPSAERICVTKTSSWRSIG